MVLPDRLLLQDFSCQEKLVAIISHINMLGLLFGQSKQRNINKTPQDVAAAPACLDPQEEDPEYEPEGKKNEEDDFQVENEPQEVEMEEKFPEATRTSLSHDSNNELGVSAEKKNSHPQDSLREDPTPHQCHVWPKEG
eukprot:1079766-Ditylum_brightwellii.AAC.1